MKKLLYVLIALLSVFIIAAVSQEKILVIYGWNGTGAVPLDIDANTNTLGSIAFEHQVIHEGDHYFATDSSIVASAAVREYLLVTPNTASWIHFMFIVTGTLTTKVELFETSTKTANTDIVEVNSDRNSGNGAGLSITHTPGGAGDGTKIYISEFGVSTGGGANKVIQGGISRDSQEIILKQNEIYLLRVTSGADANLISTYFSWYEHTNGD